MLSAQKKNFVTSLATTPLVPHGPPSIAALRGSRRSKKKVGAPP